ncbi:MAG: hypothetical protein HGGPFJEG_02625 [Ignavibacteria bacterium]|nr:hypothetical protein [Ignavibacteria bacterium]
MKTLLKIVFPIFIIIAFQVNTHAQSEYWRQIFGGPFVDIAYNCIELRDGGYMMAGYKEIQVPGQIWQIPKSYIVKFDRKGNILWEKIIGDSVTASKSLTLIEDPSGNIYLPYASGYAHLVKLNSNGEILWDRDFSKYEILSLAGVSFSTDFKKIIFIGYNEINSAYTTSITKLDSSGNLIWSKPYYDSIPIYSYYSSSNNSFLFTNDSYYISGSKGVRGFIIKTDTSGRVLWNKRYFETYGIGSIAESSENSFLISAYSNSSVLNLVCMKLDSSGSIIWKRDYLNDTLANRISANKIVKTKNNMYALGTTPGYNVGRLMIIDSLGNIVNSKFYYYPDSIGINQYNINITSDSGYIVGGLIRFYDFENKSHSFSSDEFIQPDYGDKIIDVLVFKIDKDGNTVGIFNNTISSENPDISIFPNPFNNSFNINFTVSNNSKTIIKLFDILGKNVKNIENAALLPGIYDYKVNASELSSGIYFIKFSINDITYFKKVVLLK